MTRLENRRALVVGLGRSGEAAARFLAARGAQVTATDSKPAEKLGAAVETPVMVDGAGIHPVHVGSLPDTIAELCRRETMVAQLCVDAAVEGNREKALQCLLLDPVITDIETGRKILYDYLTSYKEYLPQFWQ